MLTVEDVLFHVVAGVAESVELAQLPIGAPRVVDGEAGVLRRTLDEERPRGDETGDVDVFKVTSGPGFLGATISGIKGTDLVVEVFPSGAPAPVIIDEQGKGSGEQFLKIRADGKEPVFISLRRKRQDKETIPGQEPAGLSSHYSLEVWHKPE